MTRYIDIHTHAPRPGVTTLISLRPGEAVPCGVPFGVGVHPWDAGDRDALTLASSLDIEGAAAVGEVGLDYARPVDRGAQERVLRVQLETAQRHSLPVVLHCVRAYNDMLRILRDYRLPGVIFHSYVGGPAQTRQIADRGYCMSYGERSLRSARAMESLAEVPARLLFAETDESAVAIEEIYKTLARARGVRVEELAGAIEDNYKRIFG